MRQILFSLLIFILLLSSPMMTATADDYDQLVLDGAEVYSKGGEYLIDIPSSYSGSYIEVYASSDSSQDSWYYFVFSYKDSSGEWVDLPPVIVPPPMLEMG